jgi:hypothetical protein
MISLPHRLWVASQNSKIQYLLRHLKMTFTPQTRTHTWSLTRIVLHQVDEIDPSCGERRVVLQRLLEGLDYPRQ